MFLSWWMQLPWVNQFQKIALKTTDCTYKLQCPENFSALPCNQYISGIHTNPNLGIQMATLFSLCCWVSDMSCWKEALKSCLNWKDLCIHWPVSLTHWCWFSFSSTGVIFISWVKNLKWDSYSPLINSFYPIKS